jgi:hypothetical protein
LIEENPPPPPDDEIEMELVPGVTVIPDPAVIPKLPPESGLMVLIVVIPVEATVIDPAASVIWIPVPAVRVAGVGAPPVIPIKT